MGSVGRKKFLTIHNTLKYYRVHPGSIWVLDDCVPDITRPLSTRVSSCKNESKANALLEEVDTLARSTQQVVEETIQ